MCRRKRECEGKKGRAELYDHEFFSTELPQRRSVGVALESSFEVDLRSSISSPIIYRYSRIHGRTTHPIPFDGCGVEDHLDTDFHVTGREQRVSVLSCGVFGVLCCLLSVSVLCRLCCPHHQHSNGLLSISVFPGDVVTYPL